MPLDGRQLPISSALAACRAAGWVGKDLLVTAVAVMTAESARYVKAYHINDDGSTDRGLFQINDSAHPSVSEEEAYKAAFNVKYAHKLYHASGFGPWAAFNSGAHEKFKAEIEEVYDRGAWRIRIPLWQARIAAL